MTRSALSRLCVVLAALAVLGACGGSKSTSSSATTAAVPGTAAAPAVGASVDIKNTAFTPKDVSVKAGESVKWTFSDAFDHQVVADDKSFESSALHGGSTFVFIFPKTGKFSYHCAIHTFMTGSVTVT